METNNKYAVRTWAKIMLIISAALCAVSVFLPIGLADGSAINNGENLMTGQDASFGAVMLVIIGAIILLIILASEMKKYGLYITTRIVGIVGSIFAALAGLLCIAAINQLYSGMASPFSGTLLLIEAVPLMVASIMLVKRKRNNIRREIYQQPQQGSAVSVLTQDERAKVVDELAKLKKLLDAGILSKEEFDTQKKKLLERL